MINMNIFGRYALSPQYGYGVILDSEVDDNGQVKFAYRDSTDEFGDGSGWSHVDYSTLSYGIHGIPRLDFFGMKVNRKVLLERIGVIVSSHDNKDSMVRVAMSYATDKDTYVYAFPYSAISAFIE